MTDLLSDDICRFCFHRAEAGLGETEVKPCHECETPVCGSCAEVDYDAVGDPLRYVCCQWACPDCVGVVVPVPGVRGCVYDAAAGVLLAVILMLIVVFALAEVMRWLT